ncbi:MAG: hypothetical protein IPP49_19250 [Saprospiraceae bacterium]|nr:hypothetical protein [Saprospiraceae bacterium]
MDGKGKRLDVHQPTKLYQFRKFDRNRYCRYMMDLVLRIQIRNLATLRRRRSLRLWRTTVGNVSFLSDGSPNCGGADYVTLHNDDCP